MNATAVNQAPTADEIALLRESVRESLKSLYQGSPDEHWEQSWMTNWDTLSQQGLWSTIEQPDGSLATAAVVVEELARVLYPGPACDALAATYVLNRLPDVAAALAAANGSPPAVFATADVVIDAAQTVNGILDPMVAGAPETLLIVATGDDDLVITSAGNAESCNAPLLDVSRRTVRLAVRNQPVTVVSSSNSQLATEGRAAKTLLYCADTLGCVDHVLERTAEYASQRTTFGSPIGKYQAVAHRLVDHAVTAQQMRLLLDDAIAAFDQSAPDVSRQVATTETFFFGRSSEIISDCIQLAGAIGFTWEFGHHFYLRRAVQNTSLGGRSGRPQQRLAEQAPW